MSADLPTEPGFYLLRLWDQGGHETWRWFKVYWYPQSQKDGGGSRKVLYCSEISIGRAGVAHSPLSGIWNCAKWVKTPDFEAVKERIIDTCMLSSPEEPE